MIVGHKQSEGSLYPATKHTVQIDVGQVGDDPVMDSRLPAKSDLSLGLEGTVCDSVQDHGFGATASVGDLSRASPTPNGLS